MSLGRKLLTAIFILALCACVSAALAAGYTDASQRIHFYNQTDGAPQDQAGKWDLLLAPKLQKLYGHSEIYNDKSTSRYLTGRGCCLFSFSHAYQYLMGYAYTDEDMANVLYKYLSIKPVWSNTGSTCSPPNAISMYAAYLGKQNGVTRYTGSLSSYSKLQSFFNGSKGVCIVHAPGHYIIAVGVTEHDGVKYVQIVDSIMVGTLKSGRCSWAMSMDFSTTYTAANAPYYTENVHQYWLPYDQFQSKCDIPCAFYTGALPPTYEIKADRQYVALNVSSGEAVKLTLTVTDAPAGAVPVFVSDNDDIAVVTQDGVISAVGIGVTRIRCALNVNLNKYLYVPVYCYDICGNLGCVIGEGETPPVHIGELPPSWQEARTVEETAWYDKVICSVTDETGRELYRTYVMCVKADAPGVMRLPQNILKTETGALALDGIKLVILENENAVYEDGAFPADCIVLVRRGAYYALR